ncbi:MAG TPA: hypothetical protein ENG98_05100 [Actinobacteria bacterium]|nr:hypothetical protein BMS3Bbin02_00627 [bacterium BMS3Bbin02]HDL42373.1 hypothetical protein [Actinomycetota bacterium]
MESESDILARLVAVNDALWALPDDAFSEKFKLLKERDQLREEASEYAVDLDAQRSDADLLFELSGMRSQLKELEKQKIDVVMQAGGGSGTGEMGNLGGVSLNARMMDASGAGRVQNRIGIIKGILTDRGVAYPDPK